MSYSERKRDDVCFVEEEEEEEERKKGIIIIQHPLSVSESSKC